MNVVCVKGNFESTEIANPVGQVLVQMAIEHAKPQKLVGKLCSLLTEVKKTRF